MESPGEFLKEKRIKSNKSLKDISRATKIRTGLLEAIEEDRYNELPPRAYLRGLLKLYAQEIGVNPDEVLERYEVSVPVTAEVKYFKKFHRKSGIRIQHVCIPLSVIILVILIGYIISANRELRKAASPSAPASLEKPPVQVSVTPALDTPAVQKAAPRPATDTKGLTDVKSVAAVTPTTSPHQENVSHDSGPFSIKFAANALTWIRIQADEDDHFDILLQPGESYTHRAKSTMKLKLGNAGGVFLYFNGTRLEKAGKSGEVVDLEFPEALKKLKPEILNSEQIQGTNDRN